VRGVRENTCGYTMVIIYSYTAPKSFMSCMKALNISSTSSGLEVVATGGAILTEREGVVGALYGALRGFALFGFGLCTTDDCTRCTRNAGGMNNGGSSLSFCICGAADICAGALVGGGGNCTPGALVGIRVNGTCW